MARNASKLSIIAVLAATCATSVAAQDSLTPEEITLLRQLAVEQQINGMNTPDEVEAVRSRELDEQQASDAVGYENTTKRNLRNRSVTIISGGATEPYPIQPLSLWYGNTSSVAFFDHLGEPWPVKSFSYEQQMISINDEGCDGGGRGSSSADGLQGRSNIISFTPCKFWTTSSAQIVLEGESKPIVFDISSGSRESTVEVDSNLSVSLQSTTGRPFGRTHAGDVDLSWIRPQARTMAIDPIDTTRDREANAIVLARDVATDISFMDRSRTPWPVREIIYTKGIVAINGDCDDEVGGLGVFEPDDDDGSTFWATLCQPTSSTIGVKLEGRAGAISLLAVNATGPGRQPDGTLTIRVTGAAPSTGPTNAGEAAQASAPRTVAAFVPDAALDDFLAGAPLEGSYRATISGGGDSIQGWVYNNALYVRGPFYVVNPAYDGMARSTDGSMRVYKFSPPVSRLLVQTANGSEAVLSIRY
jgi:hypothetical protein